MHDVVLVYGTRPEAIKLAPVVARLRTSPHLNPVVVLTGQHRAILDPVNALFGVTADADLDIIAPRQTLEQITVRALAGIGAQLRARRPALVVVQGDTTTSFVAALAAFYEQIPVVHVEAGLRTDTRYSPFPEEINRRLTTQLTTLHLAPTPAARAALLREAVPADAVVVTGNTVIDALLQAVARPPAYTDPALEGLAPFVLVTAHRRESWGAPMARTAAALARLARAFPQVPFVLPVHPNPAVREVLLPPLAGRPNVLVTEPLPYDQFCRALQESRVVLTDSGGVQEEGPSLGKPVLVLRETTERPEAVQAGTALLVGTDEQRIVDEVSSLLTDTARYTAMATAVNPYGDGHAAERCVRAMEHLLGLGPLPDPFVP